MRLTTVEQHIYCDNCSYLAIVVDTETERHIYCEKCSKHVIVDKSDIESQKCC